MRKYSVYYTINSFVEQNGEVVLNPEQELQIESETDDLRYIFKDLSHQHRYDNLLGLKIKEVQPVV